MIKKYFSYLRITVLAAVLSIGVMTPALAEETTNTNDPIMETPVIEQVQQPVLITREYKDQTTVNHPAWVEPLDSGNYLVARVGFSQPSVQEINPAGEVVWEFKGVQPASARRLPNGNTLVADSGVPGLPYVPRVIEVSPSGTVIWEYKLASLAEAPRYAERLANGNTLVTLPFKIIEVNSKGQIVWSYGYGKPVPPSSPGCLERPVMATSLPDGNLLVVDKGFYGGRVFEINKKNKLTAWQYGRRAAELLALNPNPKLAVSSVAAKPLTNYPDFLPELSYAGRNGNNTLITDLALKRLIEVSPDGEIVRSTNWSSVLTGYPVMNTWQAMPSANKLLLVLTLSNSNSRLLEVDVPALRAK